MTGNYADGNTPQPTKQNSNKIFLDLGDESYIRKTVHRKYFEGKPCNALSSHEHSRRMTVSYYHVT